jgi:Papain fold toxin 1, glutamine deamidase
VPETRAVENPASQGTGTDAAGTPWREVEGEQQQGPDQLPDAATGADHPVGDLQTEVWDRHPGEYRPPTAEQQEGLQSAWERSRAPEDWVQHVNPDKDAPGRMNNCNDCTRAVESTWRGNPQVAGEAVGLPSDGQHPSVTERWAGERERVTSMQEVGTRLDQMGPGSSAMLGVDWKDGGGHSFNAVNDQGTVKYIDGQSGEIGRWPPPWSGDETTTYGIFRGP